MVGNKRPGRDISPQTAPEHKKIKKVGSDKPPNQKSKTVPRSGSSTPDTASPVARRASVTNWTARNQPESRSSASASGSRPGTPTSRRPSKNFSDLSTEPNDRQPLRVITTPVQATKDHPEGSAGPPSAKDAPTLYSDLHTRPIPKGANTTSGAPPKTSLDKQDSVTLPPPRGPAPTAPMMGSANATPASAVATTSTAMTPSSATEAGTPAGSLTTAGGTVTSRELFYDIFRLCCQWGQKTSKRDRFQERLESLDKPNSPEGTAGVVAPATLKRDVQVVKDEIGIIEKRLKSQTIALDSSMGKGMQAQLSNMNAELAQRVQVLEEQQSSRAARLKASLSPLQLSESTDGVIKHDELKALIKKSVQEELSVLKGPLAPMASLPGNPASMDPSPLAKTTMALTKALVPPKGTHSETAKLKDDLEGFKQIISAKDKETGSRMSALENENSRLRSQIARIEDTAKEANKEISSLGSSFTGFKGEKADQNAVSALKGEVTTISGTLANVLSMGDVVTKLQTEVRTTADEVKRIRKDMNTTTDPRRRIFQTPNTDMNGRVEGLQQSVEALTDRVRSMTAPDAHINGRVDGIQQGLVALGQRVGNMAAPNTAMDSRIDGVQKSLDALTQRVGNLSTVMNSRIDGIQKNLTALTQRVGNTPALERLTELQKNVKRLGDDVEQLKADSTWHGKELERYDEDYLQRFERDLKADNTRLNETNEDIDTISSDLENLKEKVRKIDQDLGDLEQEVGQLPHANSDGSGKTSALEGEAVSKQGEIPKLQSKADRHEEQIRLLNNKVTQLSKDSAPNDGTMMTMVSQLEAKLKTQQSSINTAVQSIKKLEQNSTDVKTLKDTVDAINRQLEQHLIAKPNDEVERRFDTMEKKHSSLLDRVGNIDAKLAAADAKSLHSDIASLKSGREEHTKSINDLNRILHGAVSMGISRNAVPKEIGIIQQLIDLENTIRAWEPEANAASAQQASPAGLGKSERRVSQVEQDVAKMGRDVFGVRRDVIVLSDNFKYLDETQRQKFELIEAYIKDRIEAEVGTFHEAQALQSELIEADIKNRVETEVAKALPVARSPAQQTLNADAAERRMDDVANRLRIELHEMFQGAANRAASPNMQELEEVLVPKLEQSASRIVDERLVNFNGELTRLDGSIEEVKQTYPAAYAPALADIYSFGEMQGKLSGFLGATTGAIRDLQHRFDKTQTRELAMHVMNSLLPHITQKLSQPLAQVLLTPVCDAIVPVIRNGMDGDIANLRQSVEASARGQVSQQIVEKLRDDFKQHLQVASEEVVNLTTTVQHHGSELQDVIATVQGHAREVSRTGQEIQAILASIHELEKFKAELINEKDVMWVHMQEHRDNIERAQNDFAETQTCVYHIAKRVDSTLVPPEWHESFQ